MTIHETISPDTPTFPQRIIGLTGGIGMGKSTVSNYLSDAYQLPVLDADDLAREAVQPDSSILQTIVERYGPTILLSDGSLDRGKLGDIIFNLPAERLWIDQQIHPYVRDRFAAILAKPNYHTFPFIILSVPLLFEARMTDLVTEIWVVYCSAEQQLERLLTRSSQTNSTQASSSSKRALTQAQAQARINAQLNIQKKIERADVVLDNSGSQNQLFSAIDQLFH